MHGGILANIAALHSDQAGRLIGSSWDETQFNWQGGWNPMPVWPQDKTRIQPVAFLQVSFMHSNDVDPLCIIDMGISKDVRIYLSSVLSMSP